MRQEDSNMKYVYMTMVAVLLLAIVPLRAQTTPPIPPPDQGSQIQGRNPDESGQPGEWRGRDRGDRGGRNGDRGHGWRGRDDRGRRDDHDRGAWWIPPEWRWVMRWRWMHGRLAYYWGWEHNPEWENWHRGHRGH
jgi:hypothetical protein